MQDAPDPGQVTDAWREAIAARRTRAPEDAPVPAAQARRPTGPIASRRNFIRASFWGGLGLALLGTVGSLLDFMYPRGIKGFGSPVPAGNISEFRKGGDPVHFITGQFWLVNLDPSETRAGGSGGGDGLLALWHKCPHLGCTVPWRSGFTWDNGPGLVPLPLPRLHVHEVRHPRVRTGPALDDHDEGGRRRNGQHHRADGRPPGRRSGQPAARGRERGRELLMQQAGGLSRGTEAR